MVDRLEELNRIVLEDHRKDGGETPEGAGAEAKYIQWLKDVVTSSETLYEQGQTTAAALQRANHERNDLAREFDEMVIARDQARQHNAELTLTSETLMAENERLTREPRG